MADTKKPIEEVSVEDAQAMFANAAKALGGTQGRSAGFRRVSIPVNEPVRPEPARPAEPEKPQSERKAWYLKKRQKEEEESLPISKEKLRERKAAREAAEEAEAIEAAAVAAPIVEELEEDEDIRIAESRPSRVSTEDDHDDDRYDFGATTVIPNAVVFDYYDDYEDGYDDDYEPTNADLEKRKSRSLLSKRH